MADKDTVLGLTFRLLNRPKRTEKRTVKINPNRAAQIQKGFVLFHDMANGKCLSVIFNRRQYLTRASHDEHQKESKKI